MFNLVKVVTRSAVLKLFGSGSDSNSCHRTSGQGQVISLNKIPEQVTNDKINWIINIDGNTY